MFRLCHFFGVERARVMQSEDAESIGGDGDGFSSITRDNVRSLPEEGQLLSKNQIMMRTLFPVDVGSVRVFAVSKGMSLIDLKKFGKSVGLAIKSTCRQSGYCDRLVFGLRKPAMDILVARHDVVKGRLFKFGFSHESGLFNCSKLQCFQ